MEWRFYVRSVIMVEPKFKKWSAFTVFILPCLILYTVFFILPFANGVGISFTNWDGLAGKAPMKFSTNDFENLVLNATTKKGKPCLSEKDKEYLKSVYIYDGKEYKREGVQGLKKYKIERLVKKTGYEDPNYKFIGIDNFKTIFTGKAQENFYPQKFDVNKFQKTSALPFDIDKDEFETEVLPKATPSQAAQLQKAYIFNKKDKYILSKDFNDIDAVKPLKNIQLHPKLFANFATQIRAFNTNISDKDEAKKKCEKESKDFVKQNKITKKDAKIVDLAVVALENPKANLDEIIDNLCAIDLSVSITKEFTDKVKTLSLNEDAAAVNSVCKMFIDDNTIENIVDQATVRLCCEQLQSIAKLKILLENVWVVTNYRMGVIGFTLFFAVFSVIGINVLAFALALALDTGIKGQKILRTIYFLPNVLSMIIVALVWKMIFSQLLPQLTGVKEWMMDPNKAPWLLVVVATWQGAGYYMIIYLAGLQNIPQDIVEAAMIDGTTWKQRFFYITLPMMIPSLTISLFLTIANAFKSFDLMYAMIGQSGYSTGTIPIVYDIFFQAYTKKQAGMATAEAMLLFFVIVLISGIQLYVMKKKEVEA